MKLFWLMFFSLYIIQDLKEEEVQFIVVDAARKLKVGQVTQQVQLNR